MKYIDSTELAAICRSGGPWALFLDLDGSLIDIAIEPDAVIVPRRLVPTLLALRSRLGGALAIVTGRMIETVDRILAPASLDTAGKHGGELRICGNRLEIAPARPELIQQATQRLQRLLSIHPGCLIEDKGSGLAVHWRLAPHLREVVLDHVLELASELGSEFRVQRGKCVIEILPAETGKAKAISLLMGNTPYRGRIPIFVGDDLTDEPALRLVRALGGLSVHVGSDPSGAEYAVRNGADVRSWLLEWAGSARRLEPIETVSKSRFH